MNPLPPRCYCWHGRARWRLRPDDAFCSLCGQRVTGVLPLSPISDAGPPVALALYLTAGSSPPSSGNSVRLSGRLTFEVLGCWDDLPGVVWRNTGDTDLALTAWHLAPPATLVLDFAGEPTTRPTPGRIGGGELAVSLRSLRFVFQIHAHAVEGLPVRAWHVVRPGRRSAHPDLVIHRGATAARSFLECELGRGVPVQWETVTCDHPAVRLRLLHPDRAALLARAVVRWDLTRISADGEGEEVRFRIKLRDLPVRELVHPIWWRLRRPLECLPTGLTLPWVTEGGPETYPVRVVNTDRQPLTIESVKGEAPWLTNQDLRDAPVRLGPGDTGLLSVKVLPSALDGLPGPHTGAVSFCFKDRGRQRYPVRIESVRRLRSLDTPLLIDPGPPRIRIARLGSDRPLVYLGACGDGGFAPSDLGVPEDEYARAVFTGVDGGVLRRLVDAAVARVRSDEHLGATQVSLCRHSWVADETSPSLDGWAWDELCRLFLGRGGSDPSGSLLLRFDAWTIQAREGSAPVPLVPNEVLAPLGPALLKPVAASLGMPDLSAGWMGLACEQLLADYCWSPEYAWRGLLRAWWDHVPAVRRLELDFGRADAWLREWLEAWTVRLCGWIKERGCVTGAPSCLLVGPLFASEQMAAVIRSVGSKLGVDLQGVVPRWLEWLGGTTRFGQHSRSPTLDSVGELPFRSVSSRAED